VALPIHRVDVISTDGAAYLTKLQEFADDIADGNIARLTRVCWTMAPSYIADRYGTPQARGAILEALGRGVSGAQSGLFAKGQLVTVTFSYEELASPYPCAEVSYDGLSNEPAEPDLGWVIHRAAGRLSGRPVGATDTEDRYRLYCSDDPQGYVDRFGKDRPGDPPTAHSHTTVDAVVKRLDGRDVELVRERSGDWITVADASDAGGARLVFYSTVTGVCMGDVWPGPFQG
jgi:hypothetical protein